MNSLLLLTAILSGPDARPEIPRVEASDIYRAYFFNDAQVDAEFQNQIVEFRGHVASIKRSRPDTAPAPRWPASNDPFEAPASTAPDPKPAPKPTPSAPNPNPKSLGYDMFMDVSVLISGHNYHEHYIRCRFPASAREKLAKLSDPNTTVIVRGRCQGVTSWENQIEIGNQYYTSRLLEFTECEVVEVVAKGKTSAARELKNDRGANLSSLGTSKPSPLSDGELKEPAASGDRP